MFSKAAKVKEIYFKNELNSYDILKELEGKTCSTRIIIKLP